MCESDADLVCEQVYGRPQDVNTVPVSASPTYLTNCAKAVEGIWYHERTNGSEKVPRLPY